MTSNRRHQELTEHADRRPPRPSRRAILKGLAGAASTAFAMSFVRRAAAAERSLRIGAFGGYFGNNLRRYLYPEFEQATGIRIEPVSNFGGIEGLIQSAHRASSVDLYTAAQSDVARGSAARIWRNFDPGRIPNLRFLDRRFIHQGENGIDAVGGMAWYQTLIVNPQKVDPAPTSWAVLWEPGHAASWGLASGSQSALIEITAATWFGGNAILDTEDGISQVLAKIEQLKPNVKLWWQSEGDMQSAYENDDVMGGMYFHDIAGRMAEDGTPVVSIFPKEGGVMDFGSWSQPAASTKIEEAEEFIDFMSAPAAQAMMARKIGTAPLVARGWTDLTDAEFAAVSSDRPSIELALGARTRLHDFIGRQFALMLTS